MGRKDIDNDFVEWEHTRKEHIEAMRKNPDYRFVMQVASFTNERLDKYWNGPTGSATGAGIQTNMDFGPAEDKDLVVPTQIIKDFEIQSKWSALIEANKQLVEDVDMSDDQVKNHVRAHAVKTNQYAMIAYAIKMYAKENNKNNVLAIPISDIVENFVVSYTVRTITSFLTQFGDPLSIKGKVEDIEQQLTNGEWTRKSESPYNQTDSKFMLWNSATNYLFSLYDAGVSAPLDRNKIDVMNRFIQNMYTQGWERVPLPFDFIENTPYFGFQQKMITETKNLVAEYKKRQLQKRAHRWMMSTPWATPQIYYTPMILGHMEEAHIVLQNKYAHIKKHTIDDIIRDDKARMFFAKFVSLLIRKSDIIASKRYHLDKSFRRINMEIGRVFRVFRDIKIKRRTTSTRTSLAEVVNTCTPEMKTFQTRVRQEFKTLLDNDRTLKDHWLSVQRQSMQDIQNSDISEAYKDIIILYIYITQDKFVRKRTAGELESVWILYKSKVEQTMN